MAHGICRIILILFVLLYLGAIFLLLVGTFGWFGQERDPLSGVFLLPLGLPWNQFTAGVPDSLLPWVAIAAPLLNVMILSSLCRYVRGK